MNVHWADLKVLGPSLKFSEMASRLCRMGKDSGFFIGMYSAGHGLKQQEWQHTPGR
jgi:hypothetical protein